MPDSHPHCHRSLATPHLLLPAIRPRMQEDQVPQLQDEHHSEPVWSDASCSDAETSLPAVTPTLSNRSNRSNCSRGSNRKERKERSNSRRQSELAMNLQASLKDMEDAAAAAEAAQLAEDSFALQAAQERLQVRLGALSPQKLITGDELHETLVALGLTSYGREETNMLLNVLADFIKLRFDQDGPRLRRGASLLFRKSHAALGLGTPVWEWPRPQNTGSRRISERMTQGVGRRKSELMGRGGLQSAEPERNFNVAP
ncbi:unnamed protein product [Effrenium voratum]|uniref:Uncharacterized protein n=1 Tax=Effrenium voratum TaxID=2562239 RepID=A0AA36NC34_9DINO|nr:unnamed protein product [Effrenium voratum]